MKHLFRTLILVATIAVAASFSADAKKKNVDLVEKYPALAPYFSTPTEEAIQPDDRGFIRRWLLLEPISKPNRGNTVFVDSYVRQNLDTGWNKGEFTLPKDGDKVTMEVEYQKPVELTAGRPRSFEPEPIEMKKVPVTDILYPIPPGLSREFHIFLQQKSRHLERCLLQDNLG